VNISTLDGKTSPRPERTGHYIKAVVAAVAVTACGVAWLPLPAAAASSCASQLGALNNWFVTQPQGYGTYQAKVTFASNRSDGGYVSYAASGTFDNAYSAYLNYHPAQTGGVGGHPAYISDDGSGLQQFFSNRLYGPPFNDAPFAMTNTDSLGIKIFLQGNTAQKIDAGDTAFTLYSWGNTIIPMNGNTCKNGVLFGFMADGVTIGTIAVNEYYTPPINARTGHPIPRHRSPH
jgi:hypothetical protein